ncbi:MAG: hypothetical protein A2V72_00765 [Candidatus Nealsonbacteria bacterium RBG_13_37_56]|uniref:histidine kinase n=1 Tax=Candidatus Nealsonbacteria bacterium RBG_13_37_56 TaxID=1801661 RepID=A0A1G2DW55_9BACT|nr:MAG: hypothetical protein A2V72_00765 [Candidatus Nealsonbacteria bacterium RBG_13_37_56]
MNLFAISGLLIGVTGLVEALIMFLKGRRKAQYLWGIFCFSVMLWGLGSYKIAIATEPSQAILWWRIAYSGVIFIPVFLIHFLYEFLEIRSKLVPGIFYILGIFFLVTNHINGLFIREVKFIFNQFYYLSFPPILYILFVVIFLIAVIYTLFRLWRAYMIERGIKRIQLRYLFISLFIGFSGGATSFLPVFKIYLYPFLNITVALGILIVAYAILRYRLMDIRIIVRKMVIYIGMAGLVYGAFYLVAWLYNIFLGSVFSPKGYIIGLAIAPVFVGVFVLVDKWLKHFANKYLFFSLYNYQGTISELTSKLNYDIDLDKIINSIVNTIKRTMQLDKAGVLLIKRENNKIYYKISKVIGFNEENGISLVQDNFLTRYLQKIRKPLVKEEMALLAKDSKKVGERKSFSQLSQNMEKIEASLCLPLISRNELMGIIVLGSKVSGDAYSEEDLNLLDILSKQAAIAIQNARLYKEVQEFNKTLQQKVDEQTKEIRKAYEVEKKAHEELKRLDRAKDQFVLATQHHLRTPVTGMSGYLDLIFTGSFGKIPKKLEGALKKFQSATKILSKLIDEFLDISQLQIGRKVVALKPDVELAPILDEIVEEVSMEAETKKLFIKLEKDKSLPKINADPEKLKTALFNIVDNALKYTTKGGITIKVNSKDSNILIEVKDTGKGISQQDLELLFNKLFERGDKADKFYATGRGIGLFMSTLIIEAHNGKIWAESQGQDKGSSFFIQLPIK